MRLLQVVSSAALVALILPCLAWKLWMAPLRARGSSLAFKALPR